jgi:hypothetical protein
MSLDVQSWMKCKTSKAIEHPWLDSLQRRLGRKLRATFGFRRAGRPLTDLSEPLRKFFHGFPFATARIMSRQFNAPVPSINDSGSESRPDPEFKIGEVNQR